MRSGPLLLRVALVQASLRGASSRGAARVERLREAGREALAESAERTGASLGAVRSDAGGAPLASNGWHWSIAHTSDSSRGLAAAVISLLPVGIDLEPVRLQSPELADRVLEARERALLDRDDALAFTRAWTAKESVLKKLGVGLLELSRCRIVAHPEADVLLLEHKGVLHRVQHAVFGAFLAALCADVSGSSPDDAVAVEWSVVSRPTPVGPRSLGVAS